MSVLATAGIASLNGGLRSDLTAVAAELIAEESISPLIAPVRQTRTRRGEYMQTKGSQLLDLTKDDPRQPVSEHAPARKSSLEWEPRTVDLELYRNFRVSFNQDELEMAAEQGVDMEGQWARTFGVQSGQLHGLVVREALADVSSYGGTTALDLDLANPLSRISEKLLFAVEACAQRGARPTHAIYNARTANLLQLHPEIVQRTLGISSADGGVARLGMATPDMVAGFIKGLTRAALDVIVDDSYIVDADGNPITCCVPDNTIIVAKIDQRGPSEFPDGWLTTYARSSAEALGDVFEYVVHEPEGIALYLQHRFGVQLQKAEYAQRITWTTAS